MHHLHVYQAIILGAVQGITEFLPISSTGHLRLIPRLFGWSDAGTTFDVALHVGTLIALLTYFWRDWIDVLRPVGCALTGRKQQVSPHFGRNLLWGIIIGCIPAAVAGILLDKKLEAIESNPAMDRTVMAVVAAALIVVGIILWAADKYGNKRKQKLAQMTFFDWVFIGLAQAVALIPGVSRSGSTMSVGLMRGLNRDAAARFSFLLSTPVILGAAAMKLKDVVRDGIPAGEAAPFAAGIISSTIVGYVVIRFLLAYLRDHNVNVFVWYRIALGAAIITSLLTWMH